MRVNGGLVFVRQYFDRYWQCGESTMTMSALTVSGLETLVSRLDA